MLARIVDPRQRSILSSFIMGKIKPSLRIYISPSFKFFFFFFFFFQTLFNWDLLFLHESGAALHFEVACQFNWLCKRLLAKHTTYRWEMPPESESAVKVCRWKNSRKLDNRACVNEGQITITFILSKFLWNVPVQNVPRIVVSLVNSAISKIGLAVGRGKIIISASACFPPVLESRRRSINTIRALSSSRWFIVPIAAHEIRGKSSFESRLIDHGAELHGAESLSLSLSLEQ